MISSQYTISRLDVKWFLLGEKQLWKITNLKAKIMSLMTSSMTSSSHWKFCDMSYYTHHMITFKTWGQAKLYLLWLSWNSVYSYGCQKVPFYVFWRQNGCVAGCLEFWNMVYNMYRSYDTSYEPNFTSLALMVLSQFRF